jgi:hypothetical protein
MYQPEHEHIMRGDGGREAIGRCADSRLLPDVAKRIGVPCTVQFQAGHIVVSDVLLPIVPDV